MLVQVGKFIRVILVAKGQQLFRDVFAKGRLDSGWAVLPWSGGAHSRRHAKVLGLPSFEEWLEVYRGTRVDSSTGRSVVNQVAMKYFLLHELHQVSFEPEGRACLR